jgi:hypothetical protein
MVAGRAATRPEPRQLRLPLLDDLNAAQAGLTQALDALAAGRPEERCGCGCDCPTACNRQQPVQRNNLLLFSN